MIKVLMSGCNGKMGQTITKLSKDYDSISIIAGVTRDPEKLGNSYPVFTDFASVNEKADVVVDFSHPGLLPAAVEYCMRNKAALVVGTTGLSDTDHELLKKAAEAIPVFVSANMSLGINVLLDLAATAASALSDTFDIEILEKHHNEKKDAPSGTALMIADEINRQLDNSMHYVYDRSKTRNKRLPSEIGISSIRGGTIPGEHTVIFAGPDELVEIKHTALSRDVLGRGALRAVLYISGKDKGYYNMKAMIKEML